MKRGVTWMGLVIFGTGAGLAGVVAADAVMALPDCEGAVCEAAKSGGTQAGFVALIMASMAVLSWKRLRGKA